MVKISKDEYHILKSLDEKWRWIARSNMFGAKFEAHTSRPYKVFDSHWSNRDKALELLEGEHFFQFIQWEDKEPYNIQELIEEYESEETETNDLKWLKEEVSEILLTSKKDGTNYFYYRDLKEKIYNAIDKIDEPEVLSSDWVRDNVEYAYYMTPKGTYSSAKAVIDPNKLKNVLVPKQEKVKIESVWAEDIENAKARGMTLFKTMNWMAIDSDEKEEQDLFARAWLDGFTVEEEPLYRARLKVITNGFIASYLRTQSSEAEDRLKTLEIGRKYIHEDDRSLSEFTEDELKRLDIWDSDQWEIEEVEENGQN